MNVTLANKILTKKMIFALISAFVFGFIIGAQIPDDINYKTSFSELVERHEKY